MAPDAKPSRPDFATRLAGIRTETPDADGGVADRRFLSVGGTGFLGRYLVEELLARGAAEVRILCRTPPTDDPDRDPRLTFATGSVADAEVARRACENVDVVFHSAAAYGNPPFGRLGPGTALYDINVGGVRNILAGAREAGVRQLVYTSSTNVVFDGTDKLDVTEAEPYAQGRKLDHYSRSKIAAEKLVLAANGDGLHTAILRPNGIYGPREEYITGKVLPLARLMRGLPFSLRPGQRSDWTFVYNLVWAHLLWLKRAGEAADEVSGKAYFINDGQALHTMRDVIGSCIKAVGYSGWTLMRVPKFLMVVGCAMTERLCWWLRGLGIRPPFTRTEALKAVISNTHSIDRARKRLGYEPLFSTEEGLHYMNEELRERVKRKK